MEAAADPAFRCLVPALNRLREPWISAFFNPTKEQHLSQLEHALKNQTLTATLHLSPAATSVNEGTNPDLTFLFAPSFSTGATTVGFDLTQHTSSPNPMEPGPQRSVSRAIRDDATGIFLSVTRHPTFTEIALSTLTPNGRTISLTSITNAAYHELLEENCGCTLSSSAAETLNSGIISTMHGEDNLSPAPCTKLHPMDFAAERRNFECFVNGFQTIAQVKEYKHGKLVGVDWCFAKMGMSVARDGAFVRDMGNWAIQQAVMDCRIRVPGLCVPGTEIVEEGDIEGMDMGRLDGIGKVGEFRAEDIVKILAGLDDTVNDPLFDGNTLALMNGNDEQDVSFVKDGLEDIGIPQDVVLSKSSITSATTEAPPRTSLPQDEVTNPPKEGHSSPPEFREGPAAENYLPEVPLRPSPSNAYVVEHISSRRAVPIAPGDASNEARTIISDSQRKEERRRARNRASALRSNEKKRLYLKKLKEEIAAAGQREAVLRERERLLREKNWELRIALKR